MYWSGANIVVSGRMGQLPLLVATLQRLVVSGQLASSWCGHKAGQLLRSWAVSPFLLVSQSDLRVSAHDFRVSAYDLSVSAHDFRVSTYDLRVSAYDLSVSANTMM